MLLKIYWMTHGLGLFDLHLWRKEKLAQLSVVLSKPQKIGRENSLTLPSFHLSFCLLSEEKLLWENSRDCVQAHTPASYIVGERACKNDRDLCLGNILKYTMKGGGVAQGRALGLVPHCCQKKTGISQIWFKSSFLALTLQKSSYKTINIMESSIAHDFYFLLSIFLHVANLSVNMCCFFIRDKTLLFF